jgi:hypothetical protein
MNGGDWISLAGVVIADSFAEPEAAPGYDPACDRLASVDRSCR